MEGIDEGDEGADTDEEASTTVLDDNDAIEVGLGMDACAVLAEYSCALLDVVLGGGCG